MANEPTNVLILGSGGREHALGWKLKQSPKVGRLYFAPGNGGTAQIGENLPIDPATVTTKLVDEIDYFCRHHGVTLVVIGPEDPLAQGLADRLAAPGRHVFGPVAAGARLEADKAYAKDLMRACSVPTADSKTFTNYEQACAYVEARETPVVVKAAAWPRARARSSPRPTRRRWPRSSSSWTTAPSARRATRSSSRNGSSAKRSRSLRSWTAETSSS